MGFESHESNISPGGHEFGVTGWTWGAPVPKSITFYLDNTATVADQYGRKILRAISPEGVELRFADSPPDASRDRDLVVPRPQFATHQQVLAALAAERIDWLSYEVRYVERDGSRKSRAGLTMEAAAKLQAKLLAEGKTSVLMERTIACAGWPQLPYERPKEGGACLKDLPELPPTPEAELRKIRDPELRRDALKARREADQAREKELQAAEKE